MSAQYHTTLPVDLARPPHEQPLPHQLALNDVDPFVLTALVYDSSAETPEDVYPGTVTGQVLRPDGATHDLIGTKGAELVDVTDERGRTWKATACSVTVTAGCLQIPGRVVLSIQLTDSTSPSTTVVMVTFTVNRTNSDVYVVDDAVININTLLNEVTEAAETAEDAAADALDALSQVSNVVSYTAQTPTVAQQKTARDNIGAADAGVTGQIMKPLAYWGDDGTNTSFAQTIARDGGDTFTLNTTGTPSGNIYFRVNGTLGAVSSTNWKTWSYETVMSAGIPYTLTVIPVGGTITGDSNPYVRVYIEDGGTDTTDAIVVVPVRGGSAAFVWPDSTKKAKFIIAVAPAWNASNYKFRLILSVGTPIDNAITVKGATPTITGIAGCRYTCSASAVTELTFTPPEAGLCAVRFVSGSTATILTLPNTVKMPSWWTGPEASRTYEISFEDGYGVVTSWA